MKNFCNIYLLYFTKMFIIFISYSNVIDLKASIKFKDICIRNNKSLNKLVGLLTRV